MRRRWRSERSPSSLKPSGGAFPSVSRRWNPFQVFSSSSDDGVRSRRITQGDLHGSQVAFPFGTSQVQRGNDARTRRLFFSWHDFGVKILNREGRLRENKSDPMKVLAREGATQQRRSLMPNSRFPFEYTLHGGQDEQLEFKLWSRIALTPEQQQAAVDERRASKLLAEVKPGICNEVYVH